MLVRTWWRRGWQTRRFFAFDPFVQQRNYTQTHALLRRSPAVRRETRFDSTHAWVLCTGPVAGFLHIERVLAERRRGGAVLADNLPRVAVGVGALALVAGLASANGGYFPTSWSWSSLVLLWIAAIALLVRTDVRLRALEVAALAGFAGLTGWTLLSAAWSIEPSQSVLEAQRLLVYVAALLALLFVAGRASTGALLAGVIAGITLVCAYALATRLFPERLGIFDPSAGNRLSAPVGYWNGLGIFARSEERRVGKECRL